VQELKDLIGRASAEVLEEVIAGPLLPSLSAMEGDSAKIACQQCGYSGPRSETPITSTEIPSVKSKAISRDVTVQELENAIGRSSPDMLSDAIALAFCELDPTKELIAIQCPKCRHSVLGLAEAESDCGTGSPDKHRLRA
jgi:hypothetical protein